MPYAEFKKLPALSVDDCLRDAKKKKQLVHCLAASWFPETVVITDNNEQLLYRETHSTLAVHGGLLQRCISITTEVEQKIIKLLRQGHDVLQFFYQGKREAFARLKGFTRRRKGCYIDSHYSAPCMDSIEAEIRLQQNRQALEQLKRISIT